MFEMTISTCKARSKDISYIINSLRPSIKAIKGIMVCEEFDGRVKLAIAVEESKKDYVLSLIYDAVSEAIVRGYKEEFLKKNLKIKLGGKVASVTFFKALAMFDKQGDKQLIKKQLLPCEELYIDSLYNFRLWELEKRWKEICTLVEENASYLLASNSFFDLVKFLIFSCDTETSEVALSFNGNKIVAKSGEKEFFSVQYKSDESAKIKVLGELIGLAPAKIVVYENKFPQDIIETISSLFESRVSVRK